MKKRVGYARREQIHFDKLAEEIGETGSARKTRAAILRMQRRAKMLALQLENIPDPTVLEIGAGAGAFTEFTLIELPNLKLTASDISPKCIEIARQKITPKWPHVSFVVANCIALEYENDSFDCVCGCSILHHLPLRPALEEIYRVLRPGGTIWFSEPNMLNPQIALQKNVRFIGKWLEDTEDETAYFRWPLAKELRNIGFMELSVRPFDFLHPNTPARLLKIMETAAYIAERTPLLHEIAGSLVIEAQKN